jgi:Putative DNA-binding domain
VAAFANHIGGVLVLGVADDKAQASFANPVDISDDKQRHITTVINSRIRPFVPGVRMHPIPTARRGYGFLLIIVPQSSEPPPPRHHRSQRSQAALPRAGRRHHEMAR